MAEGTPPYEREKVIPVEGSGYGTERLRPIQTPLDRNVQPGSPNAFVGPIQPPGAAPPLSADDLAQGQQQASGMYQLDPNYRPAQEPRNRPQLKQTGFLGNGQVATGQASGGDPLWAATLAAPTFQLDRSLDNIRQQKADIEKWMADATSQFKGRAADPYQKAYQDYVSAEHNKFFQDVADNYYNGDRSKAIEATRRDPELNRQFMNVNRSLGAIGDANKGGYDYYEKVDKAIREGNAEVDPETQKLLDQGLNGEWAFNGQGPVHNAAQFDRLNDRLSMNKLFDEFYQPSVKDAGDKTADKWSVETKGGRKFLVIPSETNYDEFVNSFVEKAIKDAPYRDPEEVRRFVEARVPRESTVKVDPLPFPPSAGSSQASQPKTVVGEVEVGLSANYPDNTPTKNPTPVYRVPIAKMVDGRPEMMGKKDFKDGTGARVDLVPTHLALSDLDGKLYIEGENASVDEMDTEAKKLEMDIASLNSSIGKFIGDGDKASAEAATKKRDEKIEALDSKSKRKKDARVPYNGNEKTFELFVGAEQAESAKAKAYAAREADPMRKRKESKPFVDPTKDANSPLSVYPDAKQEEDGTWYVIKDGKKKYLTRQ
jgi:hypothetical protein